MPTGMVDPALTYRDQDRRAAGRLVAGKDQPMRCAVYGDAEYQLSDDDWEWVRRTAESLGPLTGRRRHILGRLLRVHCS
jgi:hypothetical protein